jgi:hypothetical protein
MSDRIPRRIVEAILAEVELPDSAYERAYRRYHDLAEWFQRPEATCYPFDPHVYAQGSFRLGTVVLSDEYDLDMGCRLRRGVSTASHTQRDLKHLVKADLAAYRAARGIEQGLEEKPRCWRLRYMDELSFHLDAVPSIPAEQAQRLGMTLAMAAAGLPMPLSEAVAKYAGSITDNRLKNYPNLSPDWLVSNSEGHALWFEHRMRTVSPSSAQGFLTAGQVDELPVYRRKTPLQRCVQLLKHHRNAYFARRTELMPASVLLTTLAAHAYQGEGDLVPALQRILTDMGGKVHASSPRVPNPVNPAEDFADRWSRPEGRQLDLEGNFWAWLRQAQISFAAILSSRDAENLAGLVKEHLQITISPERLGTSVGLGAAAVAVSPRVQQLGANAPRPWCQE